MRVLVADDHPLYRDGLRAALGGIDDIEVIGEASTGAETIDAVAALAPDLVLLDIKMPDGNGIDTAARLTATGAATRVVMLTMDDSPETVYAALKAGAVGFLLKGADRAELVAAIRSVAEGGTVFGAGVAQLMLSSFTSAAGATPPLPTLSDREREVLALVADGLTNAAIAERLYLSSKTVRNHVSNILTKLQAANRTEASQRAREAGL
ncbi:MAG: response regulator transcription factor [Actinomycetota bacterium]|nr:response regulator transcription factor [Actinomycetota bacterium]